MQPRDLTEEINRAYRKTPQSASRASSSVLGCMTAEKLDESWTSPQDHHEVSPKLSTSDIKEEQVRLLEEQINEFKKRILESYAK